MTLVIVIALTAISLPLAGREDIGLSVTAIVIR